MVVFRTVKVKHYRKIMSLYAQVEAGDADELAILEFAGNLVVKWDFLDADTGEPLPPGEVEELSPDQVEELLTTFESGTNRDAQVPKKTA